jgi:hypothetical protein
VFVDGLHEAAQTYRDVVNSFQALAPYGFVLVDDVWPSDFPSSIVDTGEARLAKAQAGINHRRWYGDVFKVLLAVRKFHPTICIQIIGNGRNSHSQALLWVRGEPSEINLSSAAYTFMDSVNYDAVFGEGEPSSPFCDYIENEAFLAKPFDR